MKRYKLIAWIKGLPPYTLSVVCFGAICWLTLARQPLGDTDFELFPGADKVVHAIMFGGFALCIVIDRIRRHARNFRRDRSIPLDWRTPGLSLCLVASGISSLAGWGIEELQDAMHLGRSKDPADLAADIIGAFIFPLVLKAVMGRIKVR